MSKLGLFASSFVLLFVTACNDNGPSTETETGTDTQSETETGDGDGDGDSCTPAGVYGDCANGGLDACQAESLPQCLQDDPNMPSIGVCGRACDDVCDCWAAPASGDAPVTCRSLVEGDDGTCVLDCTGGQTCPDGMSCLDALGICVFSVI
jgi:hypothetical protein